MKKIFSVIIAAAIALTGCQKQGDSVPQNTSAENVLNIRAGSELKDIEPLLKDVEHNTGVSIKMNYSGTLEAVEAIQSGDSGMDVAWLASNRYAMLIPEAKAKIVASERTMITPVVLGIKESKARELGWKNNPDLTWKTISEAAEKGKFSFAMTSPASSNTGFSGLLGLAAALSGKGDAVEEKDINAKQLEAFFKAQKLTAGSSGWLADSFISEQEHIDGIINYASTILSMNRNPALREKLVLIYPKDGILSSDYPIMLLNASKRAAYDKVVAYLRGETFQNEMTQTTLRRPINPNVKSADTSAVDYVEMSFPAKLAVVDAILTSFDNNLRLPTDSTFVLDISGSMTGQRIVDLKAAMKGLAGSDSSISGKFAKFRNRETIFILPFSNQFGEPERFEMGNSSSNNVQTIQKIAQRVDSLYADGGTALFDATRKAYISAMQRRAADKGKFYSVVVMTDGVSNVGITSDDFSRWYETLPKEAKGIKVFPIMFGEAAKDQLEAIANATGGKVFDSRKTPLKNIFKEIRGYQ